MRWIKLSVIALLFIASLGLPGCCGCGGRRVVVETPQGSNTTLGQELKDLDDAYQNGVISRDEYEQAKKRIIQQKTRRQ